MIKFKKQKIQDSFNYEYLVFNEESIFGKITKHSEEWFFLPSKPDIKKETEEAIYRKVDLLNKRVLIKLKKTKTKNVNKNKLKLQQVKEYVEEKLKERSHIYLLEIQQILNI